MSKAFIACFCLSVSLSCTQSVPTDEAIRAGSSTTHDSIKIAVEQAVQLFFDTTPQAVGLSVGVANLGEIHTYHFGTVDPGLKAPPTDLTRYGIGSVTKTFTGVLLAQASLDGQLNLQDDIRDYLNGDYSNLENDGYPITIEQLVNHTSGLPNTLPNRPEIYPDHPIHGGDERVWVEYALSVLSDYSKGDFLNDLHRVVLDTVPGTRFSYSNAGPILAGYILEDIYGQSFETLVDSFITRPLGMRDTGMVPGLKAGRSPVSGFDEKGLVMPESLQLYGAAGGLSSTVVDLTKYARWHLDESDPVVQRSHTSPTNKEGQAQDGVFALGLNWQTLRHNGVQRIWQDGNIPGYSCRVVLYPGLDLGIVILANQLDRSIPARIDQMADTILETLDERTFRLMEGL